MNVGLSAVDALGEDNSLYLLTGRGPFVQA